MKTSDDLSSVEQTDQLSEGNARVEYYRVLLVRVLSAPVVVQRDWNRRRRRRIVAS